MVIQVLPAIGKFGCCLRSRPADGALKLVASELSGAFSVPFFFICFCLFGFAFVVYRMAIRHISSLNETVNKDGRTEYPAICGILSLNSYWFFSFVAIIFGFNFYLIELLNFSSNTNSFICKLCLFS